MKGVMMTWTLDNVDKNYNDAMILANAHEELARIVR